jgi:histone H3/H4
MESESIAAPQVAGKNGGKVRKPTAAVGNEYGVASAPITRMIKDIASPVKIRVNPVALEMIRDAGIAYIQALIKESLRFVDNRKAQTITEADVRSALAPSE